MSRCNINLSLYAAGLEDYIQLSLSKSRVLNGKTGADKLVSSTALFEEPYMYMYMICTGIYGSVVMLNCLVSAVN
jgi:hypothetical protein